MKASQADRSDGCPDYRPRPEMSPEAREARRLPHPVAYLQAEQDRPDIQAKTRVGRGVRVPRRGAV